MSLSDKRKKWKEELKWFLGRIDWKTSFLDARAISFMNTMTKDIDDADKHFIKELKEGGCSNRNHPQTLADGNGYCDECSFCNGVNELAGEGLI